MSESLKEFEKWFEESNIEWSPSFPGYTFDDITSVSEQSWKAALEWVLSIDNGFCSCGCLNDSYENESVFTQIKRELKE